MVITPPPLLPTTIGVCEVQVSPAPHGGQHNPVCNITYTEEVYPQISTTTTAHEAHAWDASRPRKRRTTLYPHAKNRQVPQRRTYSCHTFRPPGVVRSTMVRKACDELIVTSTSSRYFVPKKKMQEEWPLCIFPPCVSILCVPTLCLVASPTACHP